MVPGLLPINGLYEKPAAISPQVEKSLPTRQPSRHRSPLCCFSSLFFFFLSFLVVGCLPHRKKVAMTFDRPPPKGAPPARHRRSETDPSFTRFCSVDLQPPGAGPHTPAHSRASRMRGNADARTIRFPLPALSKQSHPPSTSSRLSLARSRGANKRGREGGG